MSSMASRKDPATSTRGDEKTGGGTDSTTSDLNSIVLKEGYLTKQGGTIKTWKKRWFILRGCSLYYFKSPGDTEPLGSVDLRDTAISEEKNKKQHCFTVYHPDRRKYLLVAEAKDDMNSWIEACSNAKAARQRKFIESFSGQHASITRDDTAGVSAGGANAPGKVEESMTAEEAFEKITKQSFKAQTSILFFREGSPLAKKVKGLRELEIGVQFLSSSEYTRVRRLEGDLCKINGMTYRLAPVDNPPEVTKIRAATVAVSSAPVAAAPDDHRRATVDTGGDASSSGLGAPVTTNGTSDAGADATTGSVDLRSAPAAAGAAAASTGAATTAAPAPAGDEPAPSAQATDEKLPPDWMKVVDKRTGKSYYFNKKTRETSWKFPVAMAGPAAALQGRETMKRNSQFDPNGDPLPAGWRSIKDAATGRFYYYNVQTKKTSWRKPNPDGSIPKKSSKKGNLNSPTEGAADSNGTALEKTPAADGPLPSVGEVDVENDDDMQVNPEADEWDADHDDDEEPVEPEPELPQRPAARTQSTNGRQGPGPQGDFRASIFNVPTNQLPQSFATDPSPPPAAPPATPTPAPATTAVAPGPPAPARRPSLGEFGSVK